MEITHINIDETATGRRGIYIVLYAHKESVVLQAYDGCTPFKIMDVTYKLTSADYANECEDIITGIQQLLEDNTVARAFICGEQLESLELDRHLSVLYLTTIPKTNWLPQVERKACDKLFRIKDRILSTLALSSDTYFSQYLSQNAVNAALYCMSNNNMNRFMESSDEDLVLDALRIICRAININDGYTLVDEDSVTFTSLSCITELDIDIPLINVLFSNGIYTFDNLKWNFYEIPFRYRSIVTKAEEAFKYYRKIG